MTPDLATVRTAISDLCRTSFLYVHLEPTNACNTSCRMCPRDAMYRRATMMDHTVLSRLVDVLLPPQVPMVSIVGFGEPTLHPRLVEMVRYIRSRRPHLLLKMTTNGSRLAPALIDDLYAAGLDLMEISVVGCDAEAYTTMMGGLDLSVVLRAIAYLNERNHRYLLATFPVNSAGPDDLRRYWTGHGARNVEVKGFHRRGGYLQPAEPLHGDPLGEYSRRVPVTIATHRPQGRAPGAAPPEIAVDACHKLYMFLHVTAHGDLVPCVQEINRKNVLGNVSDLRDFDEVLRLLRAQRPVFDICHGCELQSQDQMDYYARFLLAYFPEWVDDLLAPSRTTVGAGTP